MRIMAPFGMALVILTAIIGSSSCRSGDGTSGGSNQNAASANPPASPAGPPAACDNLFYPAETGAVRGYKVTAHGTTLPSLTYTEQKNKVIFGSFSDHRDFSDGVKTDTEWSCTADGLVSPQYSTPAVERLNTAYKFDSIRAVRPAIPAADKWAPGYEWTTTYQVTGTQAAAGSQSSEKVAGTIEVQSRIVSSEKVTVPAGSYDCLLVDSYVRANLRIESSTGASRPALESVRVSAWYSKGVGLVRTAFSGDIGTGTEELTSISK
jgi:hypothetical protein